MKKLIVLFLLGSMVMFTGCWESTDYELSGGNETTDDEVVDDEVADDEKPAFIENWFYREFGDPAEFPDLTESSDLQTVLAVAGWVNDFEHETSAAHQYQTTGETVAAEAGDSSSLAWLNFHTCRANGITSVSVELVEWDDDTQEYVCVWDDDGFVYIIDGTSLTPSNTFLSDNGRLAYGFDEIDYWTYE